MCKTVTAEMPLDLDVLPLAYLAKSHDGHLFEIDVNRYNGVAYIRFPAHIPTLQVVREVICALSDSLFLDDLLDDYESMPDKVYVSIPDHSPYTVKRQSGKLILESEIDKIVVGGENAE